MTPSHNSLSPTPSSGDLLCRLLSSDLNIQEVDPPAQRHCRSPRSPSSNGEALETLLLSDLNRLPRSQHSLPDHVSLEDAGLQYSDRDHTLDQLLDSELNHPPSRSLSVITGSVPKSLSAFLQKITSKEHERTEDPMDSDLWCSPVAVDDVESDEDELVDEDTLSWPSSATGEEFSHQEYLQLESRLYEGIGQWRNREVDDAESFKVLMEKDKNLTARYTQVMRDKLTLWEIMEQLEVAETPLRRALR